jgi:hypothetical protein
LMLKKEIKMFSMNFFLDLFRYLKHSLFNVLIISSLTIWLACGFKII